jgi:hypothetical protein
MRPFNATTEALVDLPEIIPAPFASAANVNYLYYSRRNFLPGARTRLSTSRLNLPPVQGTRTAFHPPLAVRTPASANQGSPAASRWQGAGLVSETSCGHSPNQVEVRASLLLG